MYRPLADRLRPKSLDEVFGQREILGENGILRRMIEAKNIPNLIFFGPPGTGKTTVAGIIANETARTLYRLNATTATIGDIKGIIDELDTFLTPNGALLYLDEIQYFNKKQQQSLLEFIENGKITLIASTTENPYFYVYGAILSRSTVFEFKPLETEDVVKALRRAVAFLEEETGERLECSDEVLTHVAVTCGGDVRKAVGSIEILASSAELAEGVRRISLEDAELVAQRSAMRFDRDGDQHYDTVSAFQKSIRGSDPDAALHYLAVLLNGGDIQSACRRLIVTAAEDVGLAYPQVMPIVMACVGAALQVGLPEAQLPLAEAVILCATAPKSNSAASAISKAMGDVKTGGAAEPPAHLRDSHYKGAEKLGRGLTYKYPHSFPNHYVEQQYLPDVLRDKVYYEYGENKNEQGFKRYWDEIRKPGKQQ